jgi:hypothetical protein
VSEDIRRLLVKLLHVAERIDRRLARAANVPIRISSTFEGVEMPVTLTVGQTVIETITESNAAGPVAVIGADITVVSSDPTIASVVDNGDGTATWTAVAPGTVTDTYSDTVYGLSGTDTITVTAAPPTAIASSFGIPTGV